MSNTSPDHDFRPRKSRFRPETNAKFFLGLAFPELRRFKRSHVPHVAQVPQVLVGARVPSVVLYTEVALGARVPAKLGVPGHARVTNSKTA